MSKKQETQEKVEIQWLDSYIIDRTKQRNQYVHNVLHSSYLGFTSIVI